MQDKKELKYGKKPVQYEVLSTRFHKNRIYQLVSLYLPTRGRKNRKNILDALLKDIGAIGSIEWWVKGSIVKKPKSSFNLILIFENEYNAL